MTVDAVTWRNSRPAKRMGAGALIRDSAGRVLVVEPAYKSTWEVPGGAVEADESPRQACQREVAEELGLNLTIGRMLCFEWQGPEPERSESLMLIFDGGVLPEDAVITLPADEIASYRFVEPEDLPSLMSERVSRRLLHAVRAQDEGRLIELEHGDLVT